MSQTGLRRKGGIVEVQEAVLVGDLRSNFFDLRCLVVKPNPAASLISIDQIHLIDFSARFRMPVPAVRTIRLR